MTYLAIDDADPRPPYEQLFSQLLTLIASGELAPGDRLAPIRQLAGDLGVAPNTVARAYRELEQAGAIISRGRRGTIVAERSAELAVRRREQEATAGIAAAVDAAVGLGVMPAEILRTVERRLRRHHAGAPPPGTGAPGPVTGS